mmetsp:Transcript_21894/g.49943  ORF Transcript_21894/g.49943 Transcript_21894/m.49943 type:complete len:114 (+) Transcript_21894:3578-3919(+)
MMENLTTVNLGSISVASFSYCDGCSTGTLLESQSSSRDDVFCGKYPSDDNHLSCIFVRVTMCSARCTFVAVNDYDETHRFCSLLATVLLPSLVIAANRGCFGRLIWLWREITS